MRVSRGRGRGCEGARRNEGTGGVGGQGEAEDEMSRIIEARSRGTEAEE